MIIKFLKLKNFRQFHGEENEIIFSTDKDYKTTLIIGNNATGKTTLLESFSWILYGESSLKSILNSKHESQMQDGDTIVIEGNLVIEHEGIEYSITRKELKAKKLKSISTESVVNIVYKAKDGLSKRINEKMQFDSKIREILPKELFTYFFFKGEKIEKIGEEIIELNSKSKSKEFTNAVRGLLGFDHLTNASKHLKSLEKEYNNELANSNTDKKLQEYSQKKQQFEEELEILKSREEKLLDDIEYFTDMRDRLHHEILAKKDVEQKQKRSRQLESLIRDQSTIVNTIRKRVFSDFSLRIRSVASNRLLPEIKRILNESDSVKKGIPGIEESAINYIIETKSCLCGHPISEGTEEYSKLKELVRYIPPYNIGSQIRVFVNESKSQENMSKVYLESFVRTMDNLSLEETRLNDLKDEKNSIDNFLLNVEDINKLKKEEKKCEEQISEKQQSLGEIKALSNILESNLKKVNKELEDYDIKDEHFDKIRNYSLYAQKAREVIEQEFEKRELEIKDKLSFAINETFKNIFETDITIYLDEHYNIRITSDYFDDPADFEHSTSQHGILAFSFIAGIIKLAREKAAQGIKEKTNEPFKELAIEPYPLVMDAPSSSFDTQRIESFSKAVLKTAEQVVLIIKDTDGNYAREYLKETIGKEYVLRKINNVETVIEEVK
ncbi:MAG: AAA family ATPase [Acholeplasmatales bacterium]